MKKKLEIILLVASLLVVSVVFLYVKSYSTHDTKAASATYYVSTLGNDTYPGSVIGPFRTIKKCHDIAASGDTCIVEGGTYTERLQITRSGITFQAQATKEVFTEGFYITGSNNVVDGFKVFLTDASTNVVAHTNGIDEGGIVIKGNYNVVKNNIVKGASLVGIHMQGNNQLVEGNEISESHTRGTGDADGMRFFGDNNIVRNNYIHNLDYDAASKAEHAHIDCFQTWVDASKGIATNILFEGNTCDNSQRFDAELKGQGFMADGISGGVIKVKNITIRNNVIRARQTYILNVDGLVIENNVFEIYQLGNGGYYQDNLNLQIKNNIYYLSNTCTDCASVVAPGSTILTSQSGYNWFYRGDNSYTRTDELNFATNTRGVNPLFVSAATGNFHLQTSPTNSPACIGGMGGSYVGAYPCVAPTSTPTATVTSTPTPTSTSAPSVTSTSVTTVTTSTATANCNVTSAGTSAILERGVAYSTTNVIPTTSNSKKTVTGTTGSVQVSLTGLASNSAYHLRCYARNAIGTSYGSVINFSTLTASTPTPTATATPTVTPTPTPTVPAALNNVYFTFAKFRYNKYASPATLRTGDMAYIKNFDQSKLRLLQVFLYDYEKKGNQGYTKSKVTSTSMFLRTNYNLPTGKRYAYVMKFQDKGTGVVATKYFVVYTTKTWLGKSVL